MILHRHSEEWLGKQLQPLIPKQSTLLGVQVVVCTRQEPCDDARYPAIIQYHGT